MDREPVFSKTTRNTDRSREERIAYFDACYAEFHQAVYSNVVKLVRDPLLAEDILQDVFLVFWENMYKLDGDRIANWLFVVSFNKSMNCLKRMRKHRSLDEAEDMRDVTDETGIDEEDFAHKLQLIDEAVELLSDRKKEIFRMYRLEGKSLEEISSDMQLSVHTIKDHLKITHKLIRTYLDRTLLHYTAKELLFLWYLLN